MVSVGLSLLAIGVAGGYALPSVVRSEYAVKERYDAPFQWVEKSPAPKDQTIHLQIGLKQGSDGAVEKHLLESSDPAHPRYGQHLTAAEINEMIRPSDETLDLVTAWLEEHGLSDYRHNPAKDWIHIVTTIEKAEELLQTKYSTYVSWDGVHVSRTPEFSLPIHLHPHIEVVQPTNSWFRASPQISAPLLDDTENLEQWWQETGAAQYSDDTTETSVAKLCNVTFTTPRCLRALYGTLNYTVQAADKNSIGITNYLNETNKRTDIAKFLRHFRPAAAKAAKEFPIVIINHANHDQGPYTPAQIKAEKNIEADLDAELVLSISWPTPMTSYATGGSPPFHPDRNTPTDTNEPYNTWLQYVLAQDNLPYVISTSYGDDEQSVPPSYAKRACHGFAQLGARGISVLFSSGDAGVGSNGTCFSNDGKHTHEFIPNFPAGCPWVTTVGATANFQPETAVTRFGSGGGFSNYFPAPSYQASTVQAYISSLNGKYDGLYNKSGRGYPDVAAQGNHDTIVWAGNITTVGGTSASSPTFASVIALVNDALLAAGKPVLGFLNPWLYSGAYSALNDVTIGSAIGCNVAGFPAKAGWDAVTGFGTPNFPKLVDAAMSK